MAHQKRLKDLRAEQDLKAATLKAGRPWPPPGHRSPVGRPPAGARGSERAGSAAPDGGGTPEPAPNGDNDGASPAGPRKRLFCAGCSRES